MASLIRTPTLQATTPPYFQLDIGHLAKVLIDGQSAWVKVIDNQGDEFLGIVEHVTGRTDALRECQVIAFERRHIFGMC